MSYTYWEVEGLGFRMKDIRHLLDAEKLRPFILGCIDCDLDETHPEFHIYKDAGNAVRLEYLEEYISLDEALCNADEKHLVNHANDGDDDDAGSFLIYEKQYPWQLRPNEITTEAQVRLHLCGLVLRFALPEVTLEEVLAKIEYIDEIGSAN